MGLFDFGKKNRQAKEELREIRDAGSGAASEDAEENGAAAEKEAQEPPKSRWDSAYVFVPVFEEPVQMPPEEELLDGIAKRLGHIVPTVDEMPDFPKGKGYRVWDLWEHIAQDKEQNRHPAKLVMTPIGVFNKGQWDDYIIRQFWSCGVTRREFAERCNYSFVCSIMVQGSLGRKRFYSVVSELAKAVFDIFPECIGIYWPGSQNLVPREYFLAEHWEDPELHFLSGGLNIRMFRFDGREEVLYDTLGLSVIGLSDLQIYGKDMEPEKVIPFLQNIASFLFNNGNVLRDGTPLVGLQKERWVCRVGDSMAAPGRKLIKLCPVPADAEMQADGEAQEGQQRTE